MASNNDGIFPGEADYRHLEDALLDGADQSRKVFSTTAANVFQMAPNDVLVAIVAGGRRMFIDRARVTYANHALRDEDFDRMWDIICRIERDRTANTGRPS